MKKPNDFERKLIADRVMDKCPHCGSTNAFEYNITLVTSRMGEWGRDVDEEVRVEYSVFPKTVKCGDCGKRVKWDVAHGVAVEHRVQADGWVCSTCQNHNPTRHVACWYCSIPPTRR